MKIETRQTVAVLLSVFSAFGTFATAVLSVRATKKAIKKESEFRLEKPDCTKKEVFKKVAPIYIPVGLIALATAASSVSSTIISRKTEASLATMAILADQGWRKYKDKVIKTLGLEKHIGVLSEIANDKSKEIDVKGDKHEGKTLYFIEQIGFFWAYPEKIAIAYGDTNQRIHTIDYGQKTSYWAMLYDFLKSAQADLVENVPNENLQWGWSAEYLEDSFGYQWVHMEYHKEKTENGQEYVHIIFTEEPILNPGDYGSDFAPFERDESDSETDYTQRGGESTYLDAGSGDGDDEK